MICNVLDRYTNSCPRVTSFYRTHEICEVTSVFIILCDTVIWQSPFVHKKTKHKDLEAQTDIHYKFNLKAITMAAPTYER